jgi:hypothetical protein
MRQALAAAAVLLLAAFVLAAFSSGSSLSVPGVAQPPPAGETPGIHTVGDAPEVQPEKPDFKVVASRKSDVYHLPDCPHVKAIKPENLLKFKTIKEALAAGYHACKACKPPETD